MLSARFELFVVFCVRFILPLVHLRSMILFVFFLWQYYRWFQEGCRFQDNPMNYKLRSLQQPQKRHNANDSARKRKVSVSELSQGEEKTEFMCRCSFRIIFIFQMPGQRWKLNYSKVTTLLLSVLFFYVCSFHFIIRACRWHVSFGSVANSRGYKHYLCICQPVYDTQFS